MRRYCFDLEVQSVILSDRPQHQLEKWKFFCGVVYDEATNSFHEFLDAHDLYRFLIGSDALITFNGLRWDMSILEEAVGAVAMAPLNAITHLDVMTMLWPSTSLEHATHLYAPEIKPRLQAYSIERWEAGVWNPPEKWKMTKARCDVESTYACLKAIENDPNLPARIQAQTFMSKALIPKTST